MLRVSLVFQTIVPLIDLSTPKRRTGFRHAQALSFYVCYIYTVAKAIAVGFCSIKTPSCTTPQQLTIHVHLFQETINVVVLTT